MSYEETRERLEADGFVRIERDDRLLDVFLNETRDRGVELWSHFAKATRDEDREVEFVRLRVLPFDPGKTKRFVFDRKRLEEALMLGEVFGRLEEFR